MRDFYEEKLHQMQVALEEKELEREQLAQELDRAKKTGASQVELEQELAEKDKHIANLRKKQKDLRDLTSVSSRSTTEISRLQNDVKEMKRRKVDLQKQLGEERKIHANELKKLKKETLQVEREANKYKKLSSQREVEAQKAQQVSRARLEELGQLRSKYKDAEKKLRLLSVKRGVMAKAGLDPILVGRRDKQLDMSNQMENRASADGSLEIDALRDFFDKKVADVVRKDAMVEKLATEWEEHFDLMARREELLKGSSISREDDALSSLELQLQYKENRIRRLASKLEKPRTQDDDRGTAEGHSDSFLFDTTFMTFQESFAPENVKVFSKVLFGMVVRERRRIAALARIASSLDERVQEAERSAQESANAFRAYVDEQRQEVVDLSQNQQQQILSLMDLVKDSIDDPSVVHSGSAPKLLILANERIHALENQLEGMNSTIEAAASHKSRLEDLEASLLNVTQENEELYESLSNMRSYLRELREALSEPRSGRQSPAMDLKDILENIHKVLHPSHAPASRSRRRKYLRQSYSNARHAEKVSLSPKLKRHVELMHTSDSADDADPPAWAKDIMADLKVIADGKVPLSLVNSKSTPESQDYSTDEPNQKSSVFDRLNDPQNFTGVQKLATVKHRQDAGKPKALKYPSSPTKIQHERKEISRKITEILGQVIVPDFEKSISRETATPNLGKMEDEYSSMATPDLKDYQSIFEKLTSPSHYTGTQKEKFQQNREKIYRHSEETAEKILGDLLTSDNDDDLGHDSPRPSNALEYTKQDVFERLQRKTTQSYAVKHNGPMVSELETPYNQSASPNRNLKIDNQVESNIIEVGEHGSEAEYESASSAYIQQDVFERLQKTTTEAYAKKTNTSKRRGI